jgi:hypothetical protein
MGGTGEIKCPGQTKTSTAALRFAEGSVRSRGRKTRRQITWPSRLGVVRRASYPSTEKEYKLKNLNIQHPDGLKGTDDGEDYRIRIPTLTSAYTPNCKMQRKAQTKMGRQYNTGYPSNEY